jgi:TM2 domain-containing membrane protein YozV
MIASDHTVETKRGPANNKSISVHRAFVYGASAPGLGEIYAGFRIRGFLTAALFVLFFAWFTWASIDIVAGILDLFLATLKGIKASALANLPFPYLIIAFVGSYYIWSWAMISSVDLAVEQRRKSNEPPQASIVWGVAISWFCPGSGQIYTGSRRFGYILFGSYLIGILLILPPYMHMFRAIPLLAKKGQLSANNPYELLDIISGHLIEVNYGFGNLFQMVVKYFAIASTVTALRHRDLDADAKWMKSSVAYGTALFGIGWLCPGSGQLLQGRDNTGWVFFVGYFSSVVLTGLAFGAGFITAKGADTLSWISMLIQWAAMIEAPFWMIKRQ